MINQRLINRIEIILLTIPAIYSSVFPGKIVLITIVCFLPIIIYNMIDFTYKSKKEFDGQIIINTFLYANFIILLRGFFNIQSNQDYIVTPGLVFVTIAIPLFIFKARIKDLTAIFKSIIFFAIPLSVMTFFYEPTNASMSFQHNISFVFILLFFILYTNKKWSIIIFALVVAGLMYDITRRSFVINSVLSMFILLMGYSFSLQKLQAISKKLLYGFSILPILLLSLGLVGYYNVFKIGNEVEILIGDGTKERNFAVDSRTGIYEDVFGELSRQKMILIGLGGHGKTKTSLVNVEWARYDKIYAEGRRGTESGMLNFIQYGGLITGFIYWLLLAGAAYKAIHTSKSKYMVMIGLFVMFKISYAFIEDIISTNLASFYLMLVIGMCYNKRIRSLSDDSIKLFVSIIFKIPRSADVK